jgi:anaerobic magnesium-protoporphyrin IX monomethyl ester cyclase
MDFDSKRRRLIDRQAIAKPRVLLVGPYDPNGGEYTFLAPPLGVWRIQGFLQQTGLEAQVFDPNLRPESVEPDFRGVLRGGRWDIIGMSTTGMTLQYDLSLAHVARACCPDALLIAGGMEATFNPGLMFSTGSFDMVVSGEGEQPLVEICRRMTAGESLECIGGTAIVRRDGEPQTFHGKAMDHDGLKHAVFSIPYERMPYEAYWARLESAYGVSGLPHKAQREARLAEIRSVRLITLNYCPMGCTFCSSTNFLHHAQGSIANVARLSAEDCVAMLRRIVAAHPTVRTVIFQDDIFVFTNDKRILPLCAAIVAAKRDGSLPSHLQFISTNRIDAMTPERLLAMRDAGFRVLGFGIENFSRNVLEEFNKKQIFRHIEPALTHARELGITPFLDLILTSPHAQLADLAETVRQAYRWILAGCEVGIYPYVIPFSGAAMSQDPALRPQTIYEHRQVPGTTVSWFQPTKILPLDATTREVILQIEREVQAALERSQQEHLPSRTRSLLWIRHAIPVLRAHGEQMPDESSVALHIHATHVTEPSTCATA